MTAPLTQAVRDEAAARIRAELQVKLTHGHDAILRRVPDLYRKIIGEALAVEGGELGKTAQLRAAQRALDRIANLGVIDFVDTNGRRWTAQSYAEMAVRTAALRAMLDAQTRVYQQRGIAYVYITNVAGQCALCADWESQVVALAPLAEPVEVGDITVRYTLADAVAAGCFHPNCRHAVRAWRPGTVIPPATPDAQAYADQQRLRYLERTLRAWRRREAAAFTPEAKQFTAERAALWQARIRQHVAETGVRRLPGREQIDGPLPSPTPKPRPSDSQDVRRPEPDAEPRPDPTPEPTPVSEPEPVAPEPTGWTPTGDGLVPDAADRDDFLDRFSESDRPVDRGMSADTQIVTDPTTGQRMIYKRTPDEPEAAEAELLGYLIGRAIGAEVPRVWRLDDDSVAMEFVDGDTIGRRMTADGTQSPEDADWYRSADADRLAVMDFVTGNRDRNAGNAMLTPDGRLVGIDHGAILTKPVYERYGIQVPDDDEMVVSELGATPWTRPGVTVAMVDEIEPRLAALRADFDRIGGDAPARFDELMRRVALLRAELERRP